MQLCRKSALLAFVFWPALLAHAGDDLNPDQMLLLQDSGGWEYISMNDAASGFPTEHVCFDGQPHPDVCSGTLTLTAAHTFVQKTSIQRQSVSRHGTYELNGHQLAFFDEFGTRDGPYTIDIDTSTKFLTMDLPPLKIKLQLHKEYKKQMDAKAKDNK